MSRRPLLTPSQRARLLSFCTAVYGLAIAIAAYPLWLRPAPPGQLPGLMTSLHLDARASFRFFASVVFLTIAVPFALRRVVEKLSRADTLAWARNGVVAATLATLWYTSLTRNLVWTVVPTAFAIAVCVVFRRVDARFSRRDVILVPAIGTVFLALVDTTHLSVEQALIAAAAVVFALRLAVLFVRRSDGLSAPLCFALSPLGLMLQSHFFARDQRYAGWPAIVLAVISPFVLRLVLRNTTAARRRLRLAIALVIYPLAAYGYSSATSLVTAEGHPRAGFFEDAQHLVPAGEILRGEKPYRDVIPPHGLIQDALLDALLLSHGPETIGHVLRTRGTISGVMSIATYAAAGAATGSADAGLLAYFAAMALGWATGGVRFLISVIALSIAAWAVRRQSRQLLAAAAGVAVLATLTSIDLGFYAIVATVAASFFVGRNRNARLRSLVAIAAGACATMFPACVFMLAQGYLFDFFRVTVLEIATLGPVYALMPFQAPHGLDLPLPGLLTAVFEGRLLPYLVWPATLGCLAVFISQRRWRPDVRRTHRAAPLVIIAVWVLVAGLSFAERYHLYFCYVVMPLLAGALWRLWRARSSVSRSASVALMAVLLIAMNPSWHFAVVGANRRARSRGPMEPGWRELGLPRAQGAYFLDDDIAVIDSVYRYSQTHLHGDDTFFDFTNRGMLYFLLNKDMPVRQIEVAFYETEERQREVITRIQNNPWVKFAIMPTGPNEGVDGVGNDVRAPLVWRYLQQNFEPDVREGAVEIWRRKD